MCRGTEYTLAMPRPTQLAGTYLAARTRFGIKFGLGTMRALLREMGHPERGFPSLLVAGTNGKGSVVAYVDAILRASGLRTGRYTSPHLVRVNERIVVGGREITDRALETAVTRVRGAAGRLVRAGRIRQHPTFFEALTAAAFDHFRQAAVDIAVLEVGMGGRLDATNVVEPLASAIVSIDFDHQAYLGTTLAAIAREKAGVLRPRVTTVLGRLGSEARAAIADEAARRNARLVDAGEDSRVEPRADGSLDVTTPRRKYEGIRPLPGRHQIDNAVVALRTLEAAAAAGIDVDLRGAGAALSATRWPGRLEKLAGPGPMILDGAHNPAAARALAEFLVHERPFVLLCGAMRDKDVEGIAAALFPLAQAVVVTQVDHPRAATPEEIAARAPDTGVPIHLEPSLDAALRRARREAGPGGTVVVAGSLYLVGAVKAILASA
jgi:dihydrofolate synthase / folylpolyglutamate synthase